MPARFSGAGDVATQFTWFIFGGMVLGALLGWILNRTLPDAAAAKEVAGYFSLITDIFLRLIRMIIAPLVFSTLISGIAHMGDGKAIGRVETPRPWPGSSARPSVSRC